jgi:hypothetical protein
MGPDQRRTASRRLFDKLGSIRDDEGDAERDVY